MTTDSKVTTGSKVTTDSKVMTAAAQGFRERMVSQGAFAAAGSGPDTAQATCGRSGVPLPGTRVPLVRFARLRHDQARPRPCGAGRPRGTQTNQWKDGLA